MATFSFSSIFHLWDTPKKDPPETADSDLARDFVRHAYTERGGPTPDLKRVYESYLDNERRRKSES